MSFRSFCRDRSLAKVLLQDNRSESIGRLLDLWAYHRQVRLDFNRPGKARDNSFVDTFKAPSAMIA
jgi:putative transposase